MEVINLEDSDQICSFLPDYPFKNVGATGQLINGSFPMICGGVTLTDELINHCECFALINGEWTEVHCKNYIIMSDAFKGNDHGTS